MEPQEKDRFGARGLAWRCRRAQSLMLVAVFATFGSFLAACGGGTPTASSNSSLRGSSESAASANSTSSEALKFAQCMRVHGIPDFPDPTSGSNGNQSTTHLPKNVNPNSSSFQSAEQACQKFEPAGETGSSGQRPNPTADLTFAECMRSHGVTNFPDSSSNGETFVGKGIDVHSSTYHAAAKACQKSLSAG